MPRSCLAIILAAGDSSRMKSSKSKVLHEIGGLPIISHIVSTAGIAGVDHVSLVVGRDADKVEDTAAKTGVPVSAHLQEERLGTAHAVLQARDQIEQGYDDILALVGDAPLIKPEVLDDLRNELANGADVVVAGFEADDPFGYGRMIVKDGKLAAIREEKEATNTEREITFCNGGLIGINGKVALELLDAIGNDNAKGEYYLTDIVEICQKSGRTAVATSAPESDLMGCNTRSELAKIEAEWQTRKREELMISGVSMLDPSTVYLSHDTEIESDVLIEPNVWFGPGVKVETGTTIHAFSHIEGAQIGKNASIGPFARLRPGTNLAERVKVGNFCEVKKADVGVGSKINHLTYVGDAIIGSNSNIGAGTITCNYDGFNKHLTEIGDNSFIGSNSSLIAPVKIGNGAYVGTGTVTNKEVPDNALAVARVEQVNIEGAGARINKKNRLLKEQKKKAQS